jgi:hydroxymethylbilane synthase
VGQGALAAEVRRGDRRIRRLLADLDDQPTRICVGAERALLAHLGGGCLVPAGAHATLSPDGATIRLVAIVADPDGARLLRAEATGPAARPAALGRHVAALLRRQGAGAILRGAVAALTGAERADP